MQFYYQHFKAAYIATQSGDLVVRWLDSRFVRAGSSSRYLGAHRELPDAPPQDLALGCVQILSI